MVEKWVRGSVELLGSRVCGKGCAFILNLLLAVVYLKDMIFGLKLRFLETKFSKS